MSDIAGFTELMGANEPETMELLRADMVLLTEHITKQGGEIVKVVGDGLLALFTSAPKAVRACIDAQEGLAGSPLRHRIAIHAGEVTVTGGDAYGDAVNVCSRIESLTVPGTVSASKIVIDLIRSQNLPEPFRNGLVQLKGIDEPVEIFSWGNTKSYPRKGPKIAVGVAAVLLSLGGLGLAGDWLQNRSVTANDPFVGILSTNSPLADENSPVAMSAEEALDQAYDEVWQEKEDFDKVKEEAVKAKNPQAVIDWLNRSPLGQRERGRRELEHWSLVKLAQTKGKELAGANATTDAMLVALKNAKDPSLDIAIKAFAEEFQLVK